jgi:hypothetical protein
MDQQARITREELRQLRSTATVGFTSEYANRVLDALEDAYRKLDEERSRP